MKPIYMTLFLAFLSFSLLPHSNAVEETRTVRKEIEGYYARKAQLRKDRDREGLKRYLSLVFMPDYTYTALDHSTLKREEAIETESQWLSTLQNYRKAEYSIESVKVEGNTATAIFRSVHEHDERGPDGVARTFQTQDKGSGFFTKTAEGWKVRREQTLEMSSFSVNGRSYNFKSAQPEWSKRPLSEDRKLLQGQWELEQETPSSRIPAGGRILKEIQGHKDSFTVYDKDGKVTYSHAATFELKDQGSVRVFVYSFTEMRQGAESIKPPTGRFQFIYRVEGDRFYEIDGSLVAAGPFDAPRLSVWKRVSNR